MTTFHSLKVARVEPETRDAVTITFAIPQALQAEYSWLHHGQVNTDRLADMAAIQAPLRVPDPHFC
ncbi:hypothetical protein LAN31_25430, partial [Mycobacterium tuberculosis]|nr:hypothetical protein [Mycobacterium tuberculosis]